ncbi:hypothetical protein [Franconibacter pulveris]|jgi:hypothetical protein|uniref:hypothetical protein n=1 Tax=Franconibacter pulveris TaxID=435910 RepID=UPI001379EBAB|nr:hypothetical protein [Franconibacter pulveris]
MTLEQRVGVLEKEINGMKKAASTQTARMAFINKNEARIIDKNGTTLVLLRPLW